MKILLATGLLILAGLSSASAAPAVAKTYSYSDPDFASRDAACISAMLEKITPSFEGLQKVMFSTNSIVRTQAGFLAIYPGAKFESRYGNAEGTLNCIFTPDGRDVAEVTVTFEGRGLAGFTRHPLAKTIRDPAQQYSLGMSSTVIRD